MNCSFFGVMINSLNAIYNSKSGLPLQVSLICCVFSSFVYLQRSLCGQESHTGKSNEELKGFTFS